MPRSICCQKEELSQKGDRSVFSISPSPDVSGRLVSLLSLFPNKTFLEKPHRPELAEDILDARPFQVAYEVSLFKFLVD